MAGLDGDHGHQLHEDPSTSITLYQQRGSLLCCILTENNSLLKRNNQLPHRWGRSLLSVMIDIGLSLISEPPIEEDGIMLDLDQGF
jgi:hypothetical protein